MSALWAKCSGMDKKRLNLSFSMASPLQREAWSFLSAVPPGQRVDAVCRAVCRMYGQEFLLEAIRQTIREELRGAGPVSEKEKSEQQEQPQDGGDVGDDVLDFLLALQNDGGEE